MILTEQELAQLNAKLNYLILLGWAGTGNPDFKTIAQEAIEDCESMTQALRPKTPNPTVKKL